jgi:5-methyltetrahydropteroyltriglutamate--homocysteine methyltransferase
VGQSANQTIGLKANFQAMQRSSDRILTTHAGALPRPETSADLSDQVAQIVRKQAQSGIDIVCDGELGKPNFIQYVGSRMSGFTVRELRQDEEHPNWWVVRREEREVGDYFRKRGGVFVRGSTSGSSPMGTRITTCTGPLEYIGQAELDREIQNLEAALKVTPCVDAFLPAPSPGIVAHNMLNEYYPSEEAYLLALADALAVEYRAIVEAGFVLQIDSPNTADDWQRNPDMSVAEYRAYAERGVEILNYALSGIDPENVRFHMCWASWHGPHVTDIALEDIVDILLKVNANAISLEAANARHEHDVTLWEQTRLPDGKLLIPGVVGHFSDFVEHPRLIAERLTRYARLVGRENVIAGTDCGMYRVGHPIVAWKKFEAMAEGARLASEQLW